MNHGGLLIIAEPTFGLNGCVTEQGREAVDKGQCTSMIICHLVIIFWNFIYLFKKKINHCT